MNPPTNKAKLVPRLLLLVVCVCLSGRQAQAGKGKAANENAIETTQQSLRRRQTRPHHNPERVPVYMPFPVPVPVPVQGEHQPGHQAGAGNRFHHHHHLHHQAGEGDGGEIKKIYLLHPIEGPKQGQHGGAEHQQQQPQQPVINQQAHSTKGGHSNDMKILPIVVIPPIAPIPQIQSSNGHSSSPRMTLSPHFNNYLLSGSETLDKRAQLKHMSDLYQDHRSFADYGGSGGGSIYRRRYKLRSAPYRSHLNYEHQPARHERRLRLQEDYGDDYDYTASNWRPRARSFASARRSARSREQLSANSIKDIIDYQTTFDDEPPIQVGLESRESGSSISGAGKPARLLINGRSVNLESFEEQPSLEKEFAENQFTSVARSRGLLSDREAPKGTSEMITYDRDFQPPHEEPQSRLSIKYTSSSTGAGAGALASGGKKLFIDDRELMLGDDEWRIESVKSVTHLAQNSTQVEPKTNRTTRAPTTKSPKLSSRTI